MKRLKIQLINNIGPDMSASGPWFICSMCSEASDVTETHDLIYFELILTIFRLIIVKISYMCADLK